MDSYKQLKISIILFVLLFLCGWYGDELISSLFVISTMIDIVLFVALIVFLIFSILTLMKNHKAIVNYVTFSILLASLIMTLFFPFRTAKVEVDLIVYENKRNTIIEMVKNNELEIDNMKNAKLPKKYRRVSTSGEITIYQNNSEGIVVGFWVHRGMLSGSSELIYSTGGDELIRKNEGGHPIESIKKMKEHWYFVITDY